MNRDLELAFHLADLADAQTLRCWSSKGVGHTVKPDGSAVTEADVAAERALLDAVRQSRPDDGFLGERSASIQAAGEEWGPQTQRRAEATEVVIRVSGDDGTSSVLGPAFCQR